MNQEERKQAVHTHIAVIAHFDVLSNGNDSGVHLTPELATVIDWHAQGSSLYVISLQLTHAGPLVSVQKSCHELHTEVGSLDDMVPAQVPYVVVEVPVLAMLGARDVAITTSAAPIV